MIAFYGNMLFCENKGRRYTGPPHLERIKGVVRLQWALQITLDVFTDPCYFHYCKLQ